GGGQVHQPCTLGTTNPVLNMRPAAVAHLQFGQVGVGLVRDEYLVPDSVIALPQSELGTRMGPLSPADRSRPRRPRRQVERMQFAYLCALSLLSILIQCRCPIRLRHSQD